MGSHRGTGPLPALSSTPKISIPTVASSLNRVVIRIEKNPHDKSQEETRRLTMNLIASIYLGGILTLLIALYHARLYRTLNLQEDLVGVTPINQKILYTINLALSLLFLMMGVISISYARELSESTGLAFGLNLLYALFWIWRLLWQFHYFERERAERLSPSAILKIVAPLVIIACYLIPVIASVS